MTICLVRILSDHNSFNNSEIKFYLEKHSRLFFSLLPKAVAREYGAVSPAP